MDCVRISVIGALPVRIDDAYRANWIHPGMTHEFFGLYSATDNLQHIAHWMHPCCPASQPGFSPWIPRVTRTEEGLE